MKKTIYWVIIIFSFTINTFSMDDSEKATDYNQTARVSRYVKNYRLNLLIQVYKLLEITSAREILQNKILRDRYVRFFINLRDNPSTYQIISANNSIIINHVFRIIEQTTIRNLIKEFEQEAHKLNFLEYRSNQTKSVVQKRIPDNIFLKDFEDIQYRTIREVSTIFISIFNTSNISDVDKNDDSFNTKFNRINKRPLCIARL